MSPESQESSVEGRERDTDRWPVRSDRKSQITNRKSALCHSPSIWKVRSGITLIEVLIAIFVLAIGLMGVAALLPVAQHQFKKGLIDQRAADLATKAFQDVETYGLDRPDKWMYAPQNNVAAAFDMVNPIEGVRHIFTVADASPSVSDSSYTVGDPFWIDYRQPTNASDAQKIVNLLERGDYADGSLPGWEHGPASAWIVKFISGDLRGEQRRVSTIGDGSNTNRLLFNPLYPEYSAVDIWTLLPDRYFSTKPRNGDAFVLIRHQPFVIDPYFVATEGTGAAFAGMPRISIATQRRDISDADNDSDTTEQIYWPMGASMAESIFVSGDDLTFEKSTDPKVNSSQIWSHEPFKDLDEDGQFDDSVDDFDTTNDVNGDGEPSFYRRAYDANYSWLAMFVPAEAATSSRRYQLSIVVFYKRHLNATATPLWLSFGAGPSVRYGGGSARLITAADAGAERMDQLKPGQWILVRKSWADVADPLIDQQGTTITRNVFRASPIYRWYRLTSVGKAFVPEPADPVDLTANPWTLNVTLDGPDWATETNYDVGGTSVALQAMGSQARAWIIDDIVGVFQRTIEVEDLPHGDYFTP